LYKKFTYSVDALGLSLQLSYQFDIPSSKVPCAREKAVRVWLARRKSRSDDSQNLSSHEAMWCSCPRIYGKGPSSIAGS